VQLQDYPFYPSLDPSSLNMDCPSDIDQELLTNTYAPLPSPALQSKDAWKIPAGHNSPSPPLVGSENKTMSKANKSLKGHARMVNARPWDEGAGAKGLACSGHDQAVSKVP
jgi:hypothetical protein